MTPDERDARERLGAWLAAEPFRYFVQGIWHLNGFAFVQLYEHQRDPAHVVMLANGEGHTLAAAIIDALEKAEV
jgi:hypothetical protein